MQLCNIKNLSKTVWCYTIIILSTGYILVTNTLGNLLPTKTDLTYNIFWFQWYCIVFYKGNYNWNYTTELMNFMASFVWRYVYQKCFVISSKTFIQNYQKEHFAAIQLFFLSYWFHSNIKNSGLDCKIK